MIGRNSRLVSRTHTPAISARPPAISAAMTTIASDGGRPIEPKKPIVPFSPNTPSFGQAPCARNSTPIETRSSSAA